MKNNEFKNKVKSLTDFELQIMEHLMKTASERRSMRSSKIRRFNHTVRMTYAFKRFLDISLTLFALIVFSPFLLILAVVIKLDSRGPLLYRQVRVGRHGKHFSFYKFRSMYVDADRRKAALMAQNESTDGVLFKMKQDPRITRVGRFIRKYSIDEIPQFFNVLQGDMSLVGPRPPLPSEVELYTLEDRKRLHVIPGITCIWQVSGRSDIPFKQQVELDKAYIQSQSIWKDILILLKTIPSVLTGRGAY